MTDEVAIAVFALMLVFVVGSTAFLLIDRDR